ncbi:MAG: class I SAM-dependent methyltransferase [candidate division FCPU426 bacterium]
MIVAPRNPYPQGFVFGRGEASPRALSLSGLKFARALAALAKVRGRVLELGCGGGQYLRGLKRRRPDLELHGVDLDPEAVAVVTRESGLDCRQADAARLPYPAGYFSAVLGFDILEHVPDPDGVLRECSRVLAPGGVLHLYVPCEGNPRTVYARRGHELKAKWGGHCQQFATLDLLARLVLAGFEVRGVRHADYWLTQQLDYLFFSRLERSADPAALWAAQSLRPGGGLAGWFLRLARRLLSAASWLEGSLRRGEQGAMGAHVTAVKK